MASSSPLYIAESADFSLRVARCDVQARPIRIDLVQELPASSAGKLTELLKAESAARVVCAVRPKNRRLHVASRDEARQFPGLPGARQYAQSAAKGAPAFDRLACIPALRASDQRWVAELASAGALTASTAAILAASVATPRVVTATFPLVGALADAAAKPVWLLDIGELESLAILIDDGARAAGPISLNLDRIAEAIQLELGLKFRGSAAKLLFNPEYDFTDAAAKIAARLSTALKAELATIAAGQNAPGAVFCTGLPAGQQWLGAHLGGALGLQVFHPDLKAWCGKAGVQFATTEAEAAVSAGWLGLLQLAATQTTENGASGRWVAEWEALTSSTAPATPAAAAPAATAHVSERATNGAPKPSASAGSNGHAPAATVVAPAPTPAAPRQRAGAPPVMPVIVETPTVKPERNGRALPADSAASYPPKPAPKAPVSDSAARYPARPERNGASRTPPPPVAEPTPATTTLVGTAAAKSMAQPTRAPSNPWFKNPAILAAAVLVVGVSIGAYFYIGSQRAETARLAVEKAQTEKRLQAEAEKARRAEQQAKAEAAAREKFAAETMKKLESAEAARQQAENEARAQAAARLANARGTLVLATDPVGATVTIAGQPPHTTPATVELKIGRYSATVSRENYEPLKVDVEVKENATTNLGTLRMTRIVGTLALSSDPAGIDFTVAPANTAFVAPDARRHGRTPATLDDLTPGSYTVTFTREGWTAHTETVTIARDATAQTAWKIETGAVKVSSAPAGATVMRSGTKIGVTPLTLSEQAPGDITLDLILPGRVPAHLSGRIERGQTLTLHKPLATLDHVAAMSELDQLPVALTKPAPITQPESGSESTVVISVIVDREGRTKDPQVVKRASADRTDACLSAIARWKFKPGMIAGVPVNTRVSVPFNFEAQ